MNVKIGVSNRHIHITEEDYKIVCGNISIQEEKRLVQTGEYASNIKLSIKTDKAQINNVRLLGPFRKYTQVEISKTDSYTLGIDPPIKNSGDLVGAESITIIGPNGEITRDCCIIPTRHIHINHEDREKLGLLSKNMVSVKLGNDKKAIFEDVYIKETLNGVFEMHIDTDDANSNFIKSGNEGDIF